MPNEDKDNINSTLNKHESNRELDDASPFRIKISSTNMDPTPDSNSRKRDTAFFNYEGQLEELKDT